MAPCVALHFWRVGSSDRDSGPAPWCTPLRQSGHCSLELGDPRYRYVGSAALITALTACAAKTVRRVEAVLTRAWEDAMSRDVSRSMA